MKCLKRVAVAALWAAPAPALVLDAVAPTDAAPAKLRSPEVGSTLMDHHQRHRHHSSDDGSSSFSTRSVQQEIEQMARRADRLAESDKVAAEEVVSGLEDVEAALETRAGGDATLAHEIRATRGALCAKQGFRNHERADCDIFMRQACLPDEEQLADQSQQTAQLLPVELCRQFFVDERASATDGSAWAPAPAPESYAAQAPAAALEAPPKEWFSKEVKSLPEQGLSGDERVDHEDGATQTDDWQREFGPKAGHRSYRTICRDHPDNEWCRLHVNYEGSDMPTGWSRSKSRSGLRPSSREDRALAERDEEKKKDTPPGGAQDEEKKDRHPGGAQDEEENDMRPGGAQSSRGILGGTAILFAMFAQLCA